MKKFKYSEITPENIYKKRRTFIKSLSYGWGSLSISSLPFIIIDFATTEKNKPTNWGIITTNKNNMDFGTIKIDLN